MFEFIAGCITGFIMATIAITVGMVLKERRWER